MTTAFQIGAFQFTAFQEGLPVGGGGWKHMQQVAFLLAQRRRAKRLKDEAAERKRKEEEQAEPEKALLTFRLTDARPMMEPAALVKLIGTARVLPDLELAEFNELMAAIVEWEDA